MDLDPMSDAAARLNAALEGRYRVERELGEGGMATVFLADDLRHERKVALKVLKPELTAMVGAERFLAEIKTIANLQHPHILPLHDSGDAEGFLYFVMPYVEGESLRQRLDREVELPVHETVRILRDLVDALAEAHANGVIHRDVKPGNIMLRGRHALVMDFGVAKAVDESTDLPNRTTEGMAVGTPTYMAPEQAAADPHVDHRADIYATGLVAYELLTGSPPFSGRSPAEILTAHVAQKPVPLREKRETVPPVLEAAVMKCLEKRPADRWQRAEDLLDVLEQALTPSMGTTPVSTPPVKAGVSYRQVLAGLGVVALLVAGGVMMTQRGTEVPPLTIVEAQRLTTDDGLEINPALSPDGRFVVYASGTSTNMRLYLRPVGGGRTIPLTDDSIAVEHSPTWSPDGEQVLFISSGNAMTVSALGGVARLVAAASDAGEVAEAEWSPDGEQIFLVRGLRVSTGYLVPLAGGPEQEVFSGIAVNTCDWHPDGERLACVRDNPGYAQPGAVFGNLAPSHIVLVATGDGSVTDLISDGSLNHSPVWSADGRTLFFLSNRQGSPDVFAQPVTGDHRPVGEPVRLTTGLDAHTISMSRDGSRMVYAVYTADANIWTMPVPESGPVGIENAEQLTFGNQIVESIRPSPDGEWLYFDSDVAGSADIWRIPIGGGTPEQITSDPRHEFAPDLSSDGTELAYHAFVDGSRELFVRSMMDGSDVQLTSTEVASESYPRWGPDGRRIVYLDQSVRGGGLHLIERGDDGAWSEPTRLGQGSRADWTSDGRRIAYASTDGVGIWDFDSGDETKLEHSFRATSGALAVGESHWSPDERFIYSKGTDDVGRSVIVRVPVSGGDATLLVVFDDPRRPSTRLDLIGDGERFYFPLDNRQSDIWLAQTVMR